MKIPEIAILYNEPVPGSGADDWDVLDQVSAVEKALDEMEIPFRRMAIHGGFMQQIEELASSEIRFVFNLVEAIGNKGELNYFIPALLNQKGIAYTGNPLEALFITTSKRLTGQWLRLNAIPVPLSFKPSEWEKLVPGNQYILKPVWEDGSAGITAESVFTFDGLFPSVLNGTGDLHWQIEQFIDGREFNVSILHSDHGPEVLPLAEIVFNNFMPGKPRIVDYSAKWLPGSFEYENTVRVFPDFTGQEELAEKLRRISLDTWHSLGLRGYARVDLRVSKSGEVFVLEANANPCISPDSGFVAAASMAGLSFSDVIRRILLNISVFAPHELH